MLTLLFSCVKQGDGVASAVLTSPTSLTFEAKNAQPQKVTVYADGSWVADVPEWVSVSPSEGKGETEVTITVSDNEENGVMNLPRSSTVTFAGASRDREGKLTIHQKGDTYKGVEVLSVSQVKALEDDKVAKIENVLVTGVTLKGFVISDNTDNLYIDGAREVKIGDRVNMNGKKVTRFGLSAFEVDEVNVVSSEEVTYPAPADITANPEKVDYLKLTGAIVSGVMRFEGSSVRVAILDPTDGFKMSEVDLHNVVAHGYIVGTKDNVGQFVLVSLEDKGKNENLVPYPVKYKIGTKDINYSSESFKAESKIEAVQGLGYIEYVPYDLEHTDDNKKYLLDVNAYNPRCTGPWPGDYWLFYCNGAVKAGSEVKIGFEARTSATGHKFWRLEYLDGEVWKIAGEAKTTTETGEEIVYTHAMNADGSTNVKVMTTVKFNKNMPACQFRFLCVANWQASGKGPLSTRNGGSARLSITDPADETYKPQISIVSEGDGVEIPDREPIKANIMVSNDLLTFEGTPDGPKKITVSSDYDFSIKTENDWLTFTPDNGLAGNRQEISVTCAPSTSSMLREGEITIVSGDSKKRIRVVQSAAGGELDPLISLVGGNSRTVSYQGGNFTVDVQANVEVETRTDVSWLTVNAAPATKAIVEKKSFSYSVETKKSSEPSVGHIYFFNTKYGLESILTVTRDSFTYFSDDFSWVKPWADSSDPLKDAGDAVSTNNAGTVAPNVYTWETCAGFIDEFTKRGYVDLNPTPNVMYLQKYYLKFGKTGYHTGIQLPPAEFDGEDVILTFDWCAQMTGKGVIDTPTIIIEIIGNGICNDSGAKISKEYITTQVANTLEWQKVALVLKGLDKDSRIKIYPKYMNNAPKEAPTQQRWYIDNIKIAPNN